MPNMPINPNCLMNLLLFNNCMKFPMWKGHYITGAEIVTFSNLACVENNLNKLSSNCNNFLNKNSTKKY